MDAETAIQEHADQAERLAHLIHREMELEAGKPAAKEDAVRRIMEAQQKAYTPAEKLAETDAEYAAYLATLRDVVKAKQQARGRMDTAKLRARLAIALVEVGAK